MLGCAALLIVTPAALAQTGSLGGTVTEFAGKKGPLGGITVRAYRENGERAGTATTKANGEYVIERLATASYKVEFSGAGFETQWYLEKSSFAAGDPVIVMEPVGKPGVDARLKAEPPKGPVNTAPPVLSGTPAVGQSLTCSSGSWTGTPPATFTYVWLREGQVIGGATGHTYVVQAADEGRDLVCQVTATNSVSRASVISNALKVPAAKPPTPPPPPPSPPPPPAPLTTVTGVSQSNSRWREGSRLATYSRTKRPPVGTTFRFVLNQRAVVSFAFTQQVAGRKVGGKCVAQTTGNRRRPSCKRTVTPGTLTFTGRSGLNKVAFQGRISRSKKLALGVYTLQITAVNSAGKRSSPRSLSFSIVR
jgi:hypothetical protein